MSKMKVAPINMTSIPRLELMAAVLAADLVAKIDERLDETYETIYYWTDSRNVLAWLKNDRDFKVFVGNRIAKLHQSTNRDHWRWVPTNENPADLPSRGVSLTTLKNSSLWWYGPDFLVTSKVSWAPQPETSMVQSSSNEFQKEKEIFARFTLAQNQIKQVKQTELRSTLCGCI